MVCCKHQLLTLCSVYHVPNDWIVHFIDSMKMVLFLHDRYYESSSSYYSYTTEVTASCANTTEEITTTDNSPEGTPTSEAAIKDVFNVLIVLMMVQGFMC